jgi:sulfate thiol esterase SoxB
MSPGVRWGTTLMPGDAITREDIHNVTSMTYGACYRTEMTGETLKTILEDVADNLFNTDPYYQQGGDMVRVGGIGFTIDIAQPIGSRISDMVLSDSGKAVEAGKSYTVAGWASVNQSTEGPQIWDVIESHVRKLGTVKVTPESSVKIAGI